MPCERSEIATEGESKRKEAYRKLGQGACIRTGNEWKGSKRRAGATYSLGPRLRDSEEESPLGPLGFCSSCRSPGLFSLFSDGGRPIWEVG